MSIYPDPSIIIAAFVGEPGTELAISLLTSIAEGELLTSWWTDTEITSALGIKVRLGGLPPKIRPMVQVDIRRTLERTATFITPLVEDFQTASGYMERTAHPLRAGDALHLAIADRAGAVLWTFDRKMADAGTSLGVDARLLS